MRVAIGMSIVVAILTIQTIPLMAAEWEISGSVRFLTQYTKTEAEASETGSDIEDLIWDLQTNSRLSFQAWSGEDARAETGGTYGRIQFGAGDDAQVRLRLFYGEWYFRPQCKLTVGKHYPPLNYFLSNQVGFGDYNLVPFGGVYTGRHPMLRLRFGSFPDTFDIGIIQTSTNTRRLGAPFDFETRSTIPRLEVSWGQTLGPLWFDIGAGYNTFEIKDTSSGNGTRIDSYVFTAALTGEYGPFFFNSSVYFGQNLKNYGFPVRGDSFAHWNTDTDSIADADGYGYIAVAGYRYRDLLRFEAGYGYAANDPGFPADAQTDDVQSYYLQVLIPIASQFFIVPEIGKIDYKQDSAGNDQGAETYAVIKWQIFL